MAGHAATLGLEWRHPDSITCYFPFFLFFVNSKCVQSGIPAVHSLPPPSYTGIFSFLFSPPPRTHQGQIPKDSILLLRRNSYTPLSSHDQVKRPRLYSAGNQPWLPLAPTPSALMPEGRSSQVSVVSPAGCVVNQSPPIPVVASTIIHHPCHVSLCAF